MASHRLPLAVTGPVKIAQFSDRNFALLWVPDHLRLCRKHSTDVQLHITLAQTAKPIAAGRKCKMDEESGRGAESLVDHVTCPDNVTMMEAWEYFCPSGVPVLKAIGIDHIWIPPASKGGYSGSEGYDTYDLYDLGEFHQKWTTKTKYGSKDELKELMQTCCDNSMGVYFDVVLGHKGAADATERIQAVKVDGNNRLQDISEPFDIDAWTDFKFEGRNNKYSSMKYNASHFNGVDWDQRTETFAIYRLADKQWADDCDKDLGSHDYLLCSNVDLNNAEVRHDLKDWIQWLNHELPQLTGLRIDAFRHMSQGFMKEYLSFIDEVLGRKNWFVVGEYWTSKLDVLLDCIARLDDRMSLFDFPLHENFVQASHKKDADLRILFDGTLAQAKPANAVTFVTNHDTQKRGYVNGTISDETLADNFIPTAYALTLLQEGVGYPMVFWGDLFGTCGPPGTTTPVTCWGQLPRLILVRKLYAYGKQTSYFDKPFCIGFTRIGHPSKSLGAGLAVIATKSDHMAVKRMYVGIQHAGEMWSDILGWTPGCVSIDKAGYGTFWVTGNTVAVWVKYNADGRDRLDGLDL
ncbi:MAG: hypothetical protein M1828_004066 [Chrysothrix sp. TS-e1954]|nr:MAG: hypothetical protein M1828_004066 [Chrysothrix sp. TS-e1954]